MVSKPLVTVIVPAYNCAQFVGAAVQSALEQTYSSVEVIVVDDGSTDSTQQVLAGFGNSIINVKQSNGGVSRARNTALARAKGDFIAFLDADDQWLKEKLDKQWERLAAAPEVGLVHTDIYRIFEPDTTTRVHQYKDRERFSGFCFEQFFWGNGLCTSSVMLRRECIVAVGGFDEKLHSAEDMDLWVRVARTFPFAYVSEPLVLYREHAANESRNVKKMLENEYDVLSRALELRPDLKSKTKSRLADIAYHAGYLNAEIDQLLRARSHFWNSCRRDPRAIRAWVMWASTFLPADKRNALRGLKQRLLSGRN